ncbi:MAG: dienelactone hydrolase family protein [Edaphobacter sp.]
MNIQKATVLIVLAIASFTGAVALAQAVPLFRFIEQPGPHPVGLRVLEQYDYSRTFRSDVDALGKPFTGERARPLQTLVWYPAQKTSGRPMTVGDYGNLLATETSFDKPNMSSDWKEWIRAMTPTVKDPMWAVRDAPVVSGHYPVVIYAPSFGAMAWENADLCEYLASHGYVVIASPDMGSINREMTSDLTGVNTQARDISFLIGYAKTLPDTDTSKIAVVGFSWGGISNLFAAARDNRISALVALDGSMRYFPGLVKQAGDVHPDQMTIPLLFFTQGEISLENIERNHSSPNQLGPSVLNAWTHGDLITVHDLALTHTEHSSMYQRNEDVWKEYPQVRKGDYVREDGITGYAWICRYTLFFLDAYLKGDPAALSSLKKTPAQNGVPNHFMTVDFRPATGRPTTLRALQIETGQQGFDHVRDIYTAMKKQAPDFKPEESSLHSWAISLSDESHLSEAISVLKLEVHIYPDSGDAYDDLGQVYLLAGQKQLSIESYKKSLEKDPSNEDAKQKLSELGVIKPVIN